LTKSSSVIPKFIQLLNICKHTIRHTIRHHVNLA